MAMLVTLTGLIRYTEGGDAVRWHFNDEMARPANPQVPERIVACALRQFAQKGYKAVSMADVAGAANVTKANLFHYFPSKEALGLAVLSSASEQVRQILSRHFESDLAPIEAVRAMFQTGREALPGDFFGVIAADMASAGPELRLKVSEILTLWTQTLTKSFVERGHLPESEAVSVATSIIDLWQGAMARTDILGDTTPFTSAERMAVAFLQTSLINNQPIGK